jgi:hypothetical protein
LAKKPLDSIHQLIYTISHGWIADTKERFDVAYHAAAPDEC